MGSESILARVRRNVILISIAPTIPKLLIVILQIAFFVASSGPVVAQPQAAPTSATNDIFRLCPAGHRLEFMFGATSLFLDPRWTGWPPTSRIRMQRWTSCPTEPFRIAGVLLNFNNVAIWRGLQPIMPMGRPVLFEMGINENNGPARRGALPPVQPGTRRSLPSGGTIVDVARDWFPGPRTGNQAGYILRFPNRRNVGESDEFVMICSGARSERTIRGGWSRRCKTSYNLSADLRISYEFLQRSAHDDGTVTTFVAEPEGLLDFDDEIRSWVLRLQRRP